MFGQIALKLIYALAGFGGDCDHIVANTAIVLYKLLHLGMVLLIKHIDFVKDQQRSYMLSLGGYQVAV